MDSVSPTLGEKRDFLLRSFCEIALANRFGRDGHFRLALRRLGSFETFGQSDVGNTVNLLHRGHLLRLFNLHLVAHVPVVASRDLGVDELVRRDCHRVVRNVRLWRPDWCRRRGRRSRRGTTAATVQRVCQPSHRRISTQNAVRNRLRPKKQSKQSESNNVLEFHHLARRYRNMISLRNSSINNRGVIFRTPTRQDFRTLNAHMA